MNNIDFVADTLMALVKKISSLSSTIEQSFSFQEKEILKLYGDYETESIGSSQLRHRLRLLPNTIKNEIQGR